MAVAYLGVRSKLASAFLLLALIAAPAWAQRNLAAAPSQGGQSEAKRIALVIGNSSYADSPLKNPANDANDVARALRELGWKVALKTNANQRQMKDAIRDFGSELSSDSVGLFYFAGHGIQYRGENFLVPVAAKIEREAHVEDETVSANFVLRQMEEACNRTNIVILDACRNNPFARTFRSATRGLAQMDAAQGALIAFATAPGSVAADGEGRNGIYTKHLLQQLRVAGMPVELMFKRVRDGVMRETKEMQVPWESSSLRGSDFYFRPGPAGSIPAVATAAPVPSPDYAALELALWNSVKDSKSADELKAYLNKYPDGEFAEIAKVRIKALEAAKVASLSPAVDLLNKLNGAKYEDVGRDQWSRWHNIYEVRGDEVVFQKNHTQFDPPLGQLTGRETYRIVNLQFRMRGLPEHLCQSSYRSSHCEDVGTLTEDGIRIEPYADGRPAPDSRNTSRRFFPRMRTF